MREITDSFDPICYGRALEVAKFVLMPCIHKTYPTEDKALSAWYRLGEKRRDKLTTYQCEKCLGWRIVFWDTARRLAEGEYSQQNRTVIHREIPLIIDGDNVVATFDASRPRISEEAVEFISSRVGEPHEETRRWLEKQARKKRAQRQQTNRFRDAQKLHVKPHKSRKQPVAAKRVGDTVAPARPEPNVKAAIKLARETARKLFPAFSGKIPALPRQPKSGIPVHEALFWRASLGEIVTWDHGSAHYHAIRKFPLHERRMSYYECLMALCVERWGTNHGRDVCQEVSVDVLERGTRDLRRKEFRLSAARTSAGRYDKRKPHRSHRGKGSRFTRPRFTKLEKFWEWLLKRATQVHNQWRADQGRIRGGLENL